MKLELLIMTILCASAINSDSSQVQAAPEGFGFVENFFNGLLKLFTPDYLSLIQSLDLTPSPTSVLQLGASLFENFADMISNNIGEASSALSIMLQIQRSLVGVSQFISQIFLGFPDQSEMFDVFSQWFPLGLFNIFQNGMLRFPFSSSFSTIIKSITQSAGLIDTFANTFELGEDGLLAFGNVIANGWRMVNTFIDPEVYSILGFAMNELPSPTQVFQLFAEQIRFIGRLLQSAEGMSGL